MIIICRPSASCKCKVSYKAIKKRNFGIRPEYVSRVCEFNTFADADGFVKKLKNREVRNIKIERM